MSTTNNTASPESPGFTESILRIINNDLSHWKLCLAIVLVPTLVVFVCVMWVIKPTFRATAVVTPPASTSTMGALSGLVGGDMSSYASLLGLSSGSDDADAIWTFLNSWELHDQVITQFDLAKHYKFKGHFHADLLKQFRKNFSVTQTKEYMLEITIEDEDYKLASDMVVFILAKADSMYNAFKTEQARQAREYFEARIDTCLSALDSLEDDFTKFQVKNNFYSPDIQLESTIKYLSEQQAEREATTVGIILLMFPNANRGTHYNYSVGSFWSEDDLFAPYDFAVQKSDTEIEQEKAAAQQPTLLYFTVYPAAHNTALQQLNHLNLSWQDQRQARAVVEAIYRKGYLELPPDVNGDAHTLVVLEGNVGSEHSEDDYVTPDQVAERSEER